MLKDKPQISKLLQIQKIKKGVIEIISTHSGKSYDEVWKDSDRDYWMTSQEAKEYGMIDEVLERNSNVGK